MTEVLEVAAEVAEDVAEVVIEKVAVEVVVLVVVVEAVEVVVAAAITVIKMATLLENALRGVMMGVTTTVIKQDKNLQAIQNKKKNNQRKKNKYELLRTMLCLLCSMSSTIVKCNSFESSIKVPVVAIVAITFHL